MAAKPSTASPRPSTSGRSRTLRTRAASDRVASLSDAETRASSAAGRHRPTRAGPIRSGKTAASDEVRPSRNATSTGSRHGHRDQVPDRAGRDARRRPAVSGELDGRRGHRNVVRDRWVCVRAMQSADHPNASWPTRRLGMMRIGGDLLPPSERRMTSTTADRRAGPSSSAGRCCSVPAPSAWRASWPPAEGATTTPARPRRRPTPRRAPTRRIATRRARRDVPAGRGQRRPRPDGHRGRPRRGRRDHHRGADRRHPAHGRRVQGVRQHVHPPGLPRRQGR